MQCCWSHHVLCHVGILMPTTGKPQTKTDTHGSACQRAFYRVSEWPLQDQRAHGFSVPTGCKYTSHSRRWVWEADSVRSHLVPHLSRQVSMPAGHLGPLPTRGAVLVGDKPLWTLVSPLVKRAPAHLRRYQVDWCRGWNETQVKVVWSENRCENAGSQFSLILTDTVWPCDLSHRNLFYHQ